MSFIDYALCEINFAKFALHPHWGGGLDNIIHVIVLPNPIDVGILPIIMNLGFAHNHHAHHHIPMQEPGDSLRVPESD